MARAVTAAAAAAATTRWLCCDAIAERREDVSSGGDTQPQAAANLQRSREVRDTWKEGARKCTDSSGLCGVAFAVDLRPIPLAFLATRSCFLCGCKAIWIASAFPVSMDAATFCLWWLLYLHWSGMDHLATNLNVGLIVEEHQTALVFALSVLRVYIHRDRRQPPSRCSLKRSHNIV